MNTELQYIAALCNPLVHDKISDIVIDFPWSSEAAKEISTLFSGNFTNVGDDTIRAVISDVLISEEIDALIEEKKKYNEIGNKESELLANQIFKYYQSILVSNAVNNNGDDIPSLINAIKRIPQEIESDAPIHNMAELSAEKLMKEELGGTERVLPTNFQIIKQATPFNGYLPGQVIQVVAPPGVGKSAWMLQEASLAAMSGFRVLWIALGDLMRIDLLARLTTIVSGADYFKVATNADKYITDEMRNEIFSNIDVIVVPSKHLTANKIEEKVNGSNKEYDLIVVDYDGNVKETDPTSMYHAGGEIYDKMTGIARPIGRKARVVFIGCQPKIQYWNDEEIPEDGAGESSKKQHVIDMMLTMGKAKSEHQCGIMALQKVRRGKKGSTPYIVENGRFSEITNQQYSMKKSYGGK